MNIYSYNNKSKSAKLLASALDCKIIKHEGSVFKGDKKKVIINWGASKLPDEVRKCHIINNEKNVARVVDRFNMLTQLALFFDVPVFTKDPHEAQQWINAGGMVEFKDDVYTWDVKPTSIIRVHQVDGRSIYTQFKEGEVPNIHSATKDMIKRTVEEIRAFLGLDFCAVTVGWNELTHRAYVLNVNTAPQLTPELATMYANNLSYGVLNGL